MKKIGKIIAVVIGAIVLLLIVGAVALVMLVDPNQYKDQITGLVKAQTGRELQINKKISLSFFPWLGVEAGGLVLSNAPGFGKEPFARVEDAGVKVKLLPLLSGRVEVDTILLRGLNANLATDRQGRNNWDDLAGAPAPEQPKPAPEQEGGGLPMALAIGGIDISRAQVTYVDQSSGLRVAMRNLDFESGPLTAGKPVDLRLAFDFESSETKAPMRINLAATAAADLERQTLDVPNLNLRAGDLVLRANAAGKQIMDAPQFDGALELDPFNAKGWLASVIGPVETADKTAFMRLGLRTKFSANTKDLRLQDLALNLDDSKLTGTASVLNFAQPAYRFDLAVDQVTLDRYLPPESAAAEQKPAPAPGAAPVVIPIDTLRALDADGRIRVGRLQAFGLKSSDVLVKLFAKDGLMKMDPTQAKLYGGTYKGATTYDARTNNPLLSVNEQLSNIDLGAFLKDAVDFDKFVGRGNVNAKFTARGMDAEAIKKTLDGTGGFAVQDGTLKGIDLARMINEIETAVKERTWQRLTNLVPRETDETKFSQLKGSVRAKDGVVSNDDLALQGPRINVSGKGSASLPAETIDYRLVVNKAPILVGGTFAKPTFKPDWNAIVKGQAEKRIEKEKGKLEEKLKQKLDERLKGLLKR